MLETPYREAPTALRVQRYVSISVVTALVGQFAIFVFHWGIGLSAVLSNAMAALVVAVVGFVLSTRFVWSSDPVRRYRVEVPAFFAMSLLGLVVSSVLVALVASWTDWRVAVNAASAASYGLVWVARFLVLDRVVFARKGEQAATPAS